MPQHRIEDMTSRFGLVGSRVYSVLQYFVLIAGLVAMCLETIPDIRPGLQNWLTVGLWCCLGFFTFEMAVRLWTRRSRGRHPSYLLSAAGLIDALAVLPIPLALLIGVPADTAWLLASLWLLKLAPVVPGLSLLGRVIEQEARPLASVFVIFLIVLAAVRRGALRARARGPAGTVWQLAAVALVGRDDADNDRLRRRCAANIPRTADCRNRHDLRPRRVRVINRYSGDGLCRRAPAPRLHPKLGLGDERAVPAQSQRARRHRTDSQATTA